MAKQKLLVSVSGGETSGFLAWKIKNSTEFQEKYEIRYGFANTGREREETLEFLDECAKAWDLPIEWLEADVQREHGVGVRAKLVSFETASRNGEPFEAMIQKYGIPNTGFPHCSRILKRQAIRSFFKAWGSYTTAIGIRADEFDRQSDTAKKDKITYPLINVWPTQKTDVNRFWSEQPFRLRLKGYQGNCVDCWKKSFRKLATIAKETPEVFDWTRSMELKYQHYRPQTQPNRRLPARFFRGSKTVDDIFDIAHSSAFTPAEDDKLKTEVVSILSLFDDAFMLDASSGCEESCEAF